MDGLPRGTGLISFSHDAFFKAVFSEPAHAAAFFKKHLPAGIAARIDFKSLRLEPGSFVQADLGQAHSDLLYSAEMDGRESLIQLVFEHQSTVDPLMPLRALGYLHGAITRPGKKLRPPLPPVICIVIHQGPDTWTASTAFEDLFDLTDEQKPDFLPYLPKFNHILLDLTQYDPSASEDDNTQQVVLQLMKMVRLNKLAEYYGWLAETRREPLPDALLGRILLYSINTDSNLDLDQIYHQLSANPELKERVMSLAEKLYYEGEETGRIQGAIQTIEKFLGKPVTATSILCDKSPQELQSIKAALEQEYESRFKGR